MSIRPIVLNGMVQNTQDISMMKQNEDNKPFVQQQALVNHFQKDVKQHTKQVNQNENAENYQKRYDARDKGSNEYQKDTRNKGKKKEKKDGKVIPKQQMGGFDVKV